VGLCRGEIDMVSVELQNIVKKYRNVTAVDNVSFKVDHGEFFVLLGPSGCGKTTTLRIIAGLETPDSGRVLFDGRDVTNVPAKNRNIGMVFQSYAVWPHMKVYDNIALPLQIKKLSREEIEKRVKAAAQMVNIAHLLDRYPFQLSGGEKQRVAVARALAFEPNILLMDEPLSNLDALLRVQARAELVKLQKELKITTIYVTHDQTEAMVLADRVAVMNKGRIMQIGTPDEIYNRPVNRFVAHFIGTPPINFFTGTVEEGYINAGFLVIPFKNIPPGLVGKKVTIGIRPNDISTSPIEQGIPVKGNLVVAENLGSEFILHVAIGDVLLRALSKNKPAKEEITLYVDKTKLHIFSEEETRINILPA
jgi:multiple sugar transport system ATP-binding protein